MKKFLAFLTALLAFSTLAVVPESDAVAQWPTDFTAPIHYYGEISAKIYDRPGSKLGISLITDELTNETLLTTDQITDLGGSAGAEVRFGAAGQYGRTWEIRSNIVNWNNSRNVEGENLLSPLAPDFSPDRVDTDYNSDFFSIEFSLKRTALPGLTLLAGPRYISLNEDFSFATETIFDTPSGGFLFETSNSFETRNSLYGFQIGAELNKPISRNIYINGFVRAGGYGNPTKFTTSSSTTIMDEVTLRQSKNTGSFVGEVGGRVYTDIIPGNLSGFVGYEATWIDGVALATNQIGFQESGEVLTAVTPFFQAITIGIGFRH